MKKVFVVITEGKEDFKDLDTRYSSAFVNENDAIAYFKKERDKAYEEADDYADGDFSVFNELVDDKSYFTAEDWDNGWLATIWIKELPLVE